MTFTHDDYTIAWICALPLEMAAAETMLDEIHCPLPQQSTDPNAYIVGRLRSHNIVIACLPSGAYGTTSAATVLSHMLPTFPSLRFGLMVGIGGGVPSKKFDIRLGDVVVSMPTASSGGVVQYDYGKALSGRFQRIGSLNKPPLCLLTAVSQIRSRYIVRDAPIEGIISDTLRKHQRMRQDFSRPDVDWLFSPAYDHQDSKPDCSTCDHDQRVDRMPRETKEPHIHYGLIASGNQVMKDAKTRDDIARDMDILCFEMEAAGLMDQLPCLVIRGISDYCDSHKNNQWQGYAALAAAAYAKDLLAVVPIAFSRKRDSGETENASATLSGENLECLRSLGFREQEHRFNEIHTAMRTCTWLLEDLQYQAWMARSRGLFWIKGNPGSGKSVLMKFAVQSMAYINTRDLVVSFFINGRGTHLQKTPLGLFRALLNGMLESFPQYLSQLTQLFEDREKRFGAYEAGRWNWAEKELQDFMSRVLTEGTNRRPVLIFVDALDECGTDAARSLLAYFKDLMKNVECEGGQLKICFSSRHYPILGLDTTPAIWVEEGNNKDIQFVIQDLLKEIEPAETRQELEEKIFAKAQGGFQWAVLVCNKVIKEKTHGTKVQKLHRMLKLIPEALDQLYSDILSDVQETERHQMLKLFRWVLFAERPLSAQELRDALSIDEDTD
ncbi:nucleoside phosphorylase domain-containing protein [Aspergillus granulosus]|uniref:Nucleoside phosphorylase domain-containing protein n=1 Tax=Aspergillus granulosus TaxID=176169 RepID=A0ABR4HQS2_9EURO